MYDQGSVLFFVIYYVLCSMYQYIPGQKPCHADDYVDTSRKTDNALVLIACSHQPEAVLCR